MSVPAIPWHQRALGIAFGAFYGAVGGIAAIVLVAVLNTVLRVFTWSGGICGGPGLGEEPNVAFALVVGSICAIATTWFAARWYWRTWRREYGAKREPSS